MISNTITRYWVKTSAAVFLVGALLLTAVLWNASRSISNTERDAQLADVAKTIVNAVSREVKRGDLGAAQQRALELIQGTSYSAEVLSAKTATAQAPSAQEVASALEGTPGNAARSDRLRNERRRFAAYPVLHENRPIAVVRVSTPAPRFTPLDQDLALVAAIAIILLTIPAAIAAGASARGVTDVIASVREGTSRFAQGDVARRIPTASFRELSELAEAINHMGLLLDERVQTALRQRKELDTVLDSMLEGVLAVDSENRVISINRAAGKLFGIDPQKMKGRSIEEVVRNVELHACVRHALELGEAMEHEVVLMDQGERVVRVRGAAMLNDHHSTGAVLVFEDVTRLRQLEQTRQDFFANVSHELRTPLTAIKGYAETLYKGGDEDSATSHRFLGIILKQADRLCALVEDILALAAFERAEESERAPFESVNLMTCIENAIRTCAPKADAKGVRLAVHGSGPTFLRGNSALFEQIFLNLIDNAIKYSEPADSVDIVVEEHDDRTSVHVRDQGCGIPAEHLPRIFERFYRVDRARSRALGGTGLGLAIVKHSVGLLGGTVEVESHPGKGSTFTVRFPHDRETGQA